METIIKDQLWDFLLGKKLITKHQHGFMRKHSTSSNLLEKTHDWIAGLCRGNNIDVVYFDFNKVFDSIVFSKFLAKLKQYGILGNLLTWISLHSRQNSTCCSGELFFISS